MTSRRIIAGLVLLFIVGAGVGYYLFLPRHSVAVSVVDPAAVARVKPSDITEGEADAPVTLIEYGSPSCTACAYFSNEVLPRLKAAYIDTGKLLYVYRFFLIFPPQDVDVARLAMCLPGPQRLPFLEMMYRTQAEWDRAEYPNIPDPEAGLQRMARRAGFTDEQMASCRAPNPAVDDVINRAAQEGQAAFNITGTPTIVVNGKTVPRFDYDSVAAAIEAELAGK